MRMSPISRTPSGNSPRRPVEEERLAVDKGQPAEVVNRKATEMILASRQAAARIQQQAAAVV